MHGKKTTTHQREFLANPEISYVVHSVKTNMETVQIIATSAEVTPNGGLVRESPSKSP